MSEKSRTNIMMEAKTIGEEHYKYAPIPHGKLTLYIPLHGWDLRVEYNWDLVDHVHYKTIVAWINGFRLGILTANKGA